MPVGEPDWAPHVAPLAFAGELARHRREAAGPEEFAATMPAEWIAELTLAGTPGEARARIRARHEAGATSCVLAPVGPDAPDALDQLGRVLDAP